MKYGVTQGSVYGPLLFFQWNHSMQGWTASTRHVVTRKRTTLKEICLERTYSYMCLLILDLKAFRS